MATEQIETAADGRVNAGRARDRAAVALAFVSGATDATGLLALGGTFTSVMTGNLVLFGSGLAQSDRDLYLHAAAAIAAFVIGAAVGTRVAGTSTSTDPVWPVAVNRALLVEFVVFAVYAGFYWGTGNHPVGTLMAVLLALNAFALGMQSSAIQRFGVSGLSTTYMTGTLTTLVIRLASGKPLRDVAHSGTLLISLVVGAAAAAAALRWAEGLVPAIQLLGVGFALGLGMWSTRRHGQAPR
ncbi:DUF1275 family protein [Kineosporia succinea]|uniref:Uncharacterized membrane protein YoaK (UPF0700 family) n=1 Tax=Kineosporia succinea TaxID=84632 RepID=A0ABT9P0J4_9ACTN|nr:YoaK family protein [Kineosporia succinea]MDP9826197.1 uncharacterized membrane protein YoaK (UPF0700 family) [Kineosporia succinea]